MPTQINDNDEQIPIKSEEFAMKEMPKIANCKAYTLSSFITPQNAEGKRKKYYFISSYTRQKRLLKKQYKKAYEYRITHPLIQTLIGYIEASKCRTLDKFIGS